MEKSANARLPAMKKKELVALMKQSLGAIQQQKNSHDADTLTTNADKSSISTQYLL
jgi:hypothetical protein